MVILCPYLFVSSQTSQKVFRTWHWRTVSDRLPLSVLCGNVCSKTDQFFNIIKIRQRFCKLTNKTCRINCFFGCVIIVYILFIQTLAYVADQSKRRLGFSLSIAKCFLNHTSFDLFIAENISEFDLEEGISYSNKS